MTKSKSGGLTKLPKDQRCHFIVGPVSSWFMPDTSDIWTQPVLSNEKDKQAKNQIAGDSGVSQEDVMEYEQPPYEENTSLSYFIYGSIGCFCYGEIRRHHAGLKSTNGQSESYNPISALVNCLIDVKEDNSRVSCVRFLKNSPFPLAMILTESGSFLIHDCMLSENLVCFKKSELIAKFVGSTNEESYNTEHCNKKARFNITQQINSCLWPNATNAFLGLSLLKEKTNLLIWLKLKDVTKARGSTNLKPDIIESYEKIDLKLDQYSSPICIMESAMIDSETCIIALATDEGLITVVVVNFTTGQSKRVIKLARHKDQVCSMSFYVGNNKKFPLGLLSSISRNGLALIWDVEKEFYFADYLAVPDTGRPAGSRINWFALSFITSPNSKQLSLAVSNNENGLTLLEIPENVRSKIRLQEPKKDKQKKQLGTEQTLRHHALLFNVIYDPLSETILTSSLDGNHLLWQVQSQSSLENKKDNLNLSTQPQYLLPSMPNNSRTHMLRHSPIREDLVGLALGKAGVRFHKVASSPIYHRFDMNPSCALISRRITKASISPTSIAWHPSHEYRIALGTLEGKVFRADLTPRKAILAEAEYKLVTSLDNRFTQPNDNDDPFGVEYNPIERGTDIEPSNEQNRRYKTDAVYSLCWGPNPICPDDISRHAIYAVGSMSHQLFIYYSKKDNSDKLNNYLVEFHDQSLPEAQSQCSEVAWKSSMEFMALGTIDGKIIIVSYLEESHAERSNNKLFRKLAVIEGPLVGSYIQCLVWHPTTDKDDQYYYYIVSSSNESPAFVFNIKENILVADVNTRLKIEYSDSIKYTDPQTNILMSFVYKLDAHKKPISDIAWNPHEPNELATASFDRLCYVWSLNGTEAHATSKFSARDRLFTIDWSLVDRDLIFTSGHDSTILAWRPSENRIKLGTELS